MKKDIQNLTKAKAIVARFLGYKTYGELQKLPKEDKHLKNQYFIQTLPNGKINSGRYNYEAEDMPFDTNWEWLMPACEKFAYMEFPCSKLPKKFIELCNSLDKAVTSYDPEQAFRQLVKCIEWYNEVSDPKQNPNAKTELPPHFFDEYNRTLHIEPIDADLSDLDNIKPVPTAKFTITGKITSIKKGELNHLNID